MTPGNALTSADIDTRLGPTGIAEVTACLWRVDCQSCGIPLGAGAAALVVDQMGPAAWASLHHAQCARPQWNDSGVIVVNPANQTHRSQLVLMPVHGPDPAAGPQVLPLMIVNPALECVPLNQVDGRWQPCFDEAFPSAGMIPPGHGLIIRDPVPGAVAFLTAASAAVTLRTRPDIVYQSPLDHHDDTALGRREIISQGGIMLAVSHAVDPAATDDLGRQFGGALEAGSVLMGWVALHV